MTLRLLAFSALGAFAANTAGPVPTFHKNIEGILQRNCQNCHRPGEAAPMSFLDYKSVRPWAKAIKGAVLARKMPPWFADDSGVKFHNDRRLAQADVDTIVRWVEAGAPQGNPKDAPKPATFTDGWSIPKPDVVFRVPKPYSIPAEGVVDYQHIVVPTNFTEDKWVQFAEARPGNRAVTHHIVVYVREPDSAYYADEPKNEWIVPRKRGEARPAEGAPRRAGSATPTELFVGYAPGMPPVELQPGQGRLIKAGSDLVFQLHYTPNGKAAVDTSELGLVFSKVPVTERVMTQVAMNVGFTIPPHAANHEVRSSYLVNVPGRIIDFNPHMHVRGKDYEYKIVYPDGREQIALRVKYDFNWQLYYKPAAPIEVVPGTRVEGLAHFDNSANNPANPDPAKEVRFGPQTWEEMMNGWFSLAFDAKLDPAELGKRKRPAPTGF